MKVVIAGQQVELGTVEAAPTIGIVDFSRRVTDDFGVTTVVERSFARRMSVRLSLPFDQVDNVQRRLADLRAVPTQWIADDRFAWLNFEGFYKEFNLDLAVPPLSYCTLTVEGLAESEPGADNGGDPAPAGLASSLLLLQPVAITDAMLVATNVNEADYPAWSGATTYALGARVIKAVTHRIYESAAAGNVGNDPAAATGQWIDVGPTNRWAMLDQALGTATSRVGGLSITLAPGAIDAVALLDVNGSTVRVQKGAFDQTVAVGPGPLTFLALPATAAQVTITVGGAGEVSVGTLLVGGVVKLGVTGDSPTAGITDFSRKETDDFGEVTVVERAWGKRMSARALIRTDAVDQVANRIASVRARPCLWIGDEGSDSLTVYGFFKDFSIEVGENVSTVSLSVEGLSEAAPLAPLQAAANWPDVVDSDPASRPKPQDGATVGAPAGTPVGDRPAETVNSQLDASASEIDQLWNTYGDTESAAASALAAAASRDAAQAARDTAQSASATADSARALAETARNQSQAARDAAQAARDLASGHSTAASDAKTAAQSAQTAAANSASAAGSSASGASGSATAAAGSATNAQSSATAAGNSATSASGSANTASTKASDAAGSASAAASSASAAASSASAASASQTAAGQSASAAQTSATNASTHASNASTSASQASTSASNAAGSASTAQTQATNAANSASAASGSASAASGSASTATTQATNAANSASAASGHANTASTQATNASNSATAASTSASGASSSQSAAATSASAANSSNLSATTAAAVTFPSDFTQDARFWNTDHANLFGTALVGSFETVAGVGRVYRTPGSAGLVAVVPKGYVAGVTGRRYRLIARARLLTASTNGTPANWYLHAFLAYNADGSYDPGRDSLGDANTTPAVADGWVTKTVEAVVSAGTVLLRPVVAFNNGGGNGVFQLVSALWEDVTAIAAAAASASASAASASSAAASETAAGQSASAANTAKLAAETARGQAQTSATNAATSETNAAGSASAASASQSAAVTARTGAETARTAAEAARDAAQGSAGAAASSASAASASQSAAGSSATAAQGSATSADTARSQAQTAASNASTSSTNATTSASAASASQSLAASANDAARAAAAITFPSDFTQDSRFWMKWNQSVFDSLSTLQGSFVDVAGVGRVYQSPAADQAVVTRGYLRVIAGRRYRLTATARLLTASTGSQVAQWYLHVVFPYHDGGTLANSGSPQSAITKPTVATGWHTISAEYTVPTPAPGDWVYIKPCVAFNFNGGGNGVFQLQSVHWEDITDSAAAASSASASAASASQASASQTAAGNSAGSASTSANTASTQATNAGSSATAAANSSASAASHSSAAGASAASAQSSMQLAASAAIGALNRNPAFTDYPNASGGAAHWNLVNPSPGLVYRTPNAEQGGYAMVLEAAANQNSWSRTDIPSLSPGYYVMECRFFLEYGTLMGAGLVGYDGAGNGYRFGFDRYPDATNTIRGANAPSALYSFSKLVYVTHPGLFQLYVVGHSPGDFPGGPYVANKLAFTRALLRPASELEIAAGRVSTIEASVTTLQSVSAATNGRTQAHWAVSANAGGAVAAIEARAITTPGGQSASGVGIVAEEFSVTSTTGGVRRRVMRIAGQEVVIDGSLTASSGIFLGSGTKWQVALRQKDYSVGDGQAVGFGGLDLGNYVVEFGKDNLAPLAAGETYKLYLDAKTGTGFTARLKIVTPGSSASVNISNSTVPGSGPTRQLQRGTNAEASSYSYTLTVSGTYTGTAYSNSYQ